MQGRLSSFFGLGVHWLGMVELERRGGYGLLAAAPFEEEVPRA